MGMKVKLTVVACMVLFLGLVFGSFGSVNTASAQEAVTTTVKFDYYVVAGYEMVPTPPSPAPPPKGFQFTGDSFRGNLSGIFKIGNTTVYNFGNITKAPGKDYLYEGGETSPTGSAYARVNITNLLGYDITVTNLTVEVTDGTPTKRFFFLPAGGLWFSNFTLLQVDTLDPWNASLPPVSIIDECDYNTGEVRVLRDGDWWTKAVGIPEPRGEHQTGLTPLLEPDYKGDAEATGHVAPIPLANGSTLTEYFGVVVFGDVDVGTQINGTITLALTYEFVPPPGYPVPSFTYTPTTPIVNETVTFDASGSTPNGGNITSYAWDFGDGTNGTGMIVNHTYTAPGTYTVILNVTDDEGLSLTASKDIKVNGSQVSVAPEFPWLWVGIGVAAIIVVVAIVVVVVIRRRK